MITSTYNLKHEYEVTRKGRYGSTTQNVQYTTEDLYEAYQEWADHPYGREHKWDAWCDIRDCVPRGTNARIRRYYKNMN